MMMCQSFALGTRTIQWLEDKEMYKQTYTVIMYTLEYTRHAKCAQEDVQDAGNTTTVPISKSKASQIFNSDYNK